MKKNLLIVLVLFSVTLNLVFVASYIYHRLHFSKSGHVCDSNLIYERLGLSSKQIEKFGPERDRFHAFVDRESRLIRKREIELIGLLSTENPDMKAITEKEKEIQFLQQAIQDGVIEHLLTEARILTPEQRTRFFGLIRERIRQSSPGRPRWMPGTHNREGRQ